MKLTKIISETPLPDTWDKEVYKTGTPFVQIIRYAVERSKKIGAGSSRVAFVVEYEGRPTVLKIAKNKKGVAQNDFESEMFNDYFVLKRDITIPMIDYDEDNESPLWIHVEKADKLTASQFKKFFGISHHELEGLVLHFTDKHLDRYYDSDEYQKLWENEYISAVVDIVGHFDVPAGDFGTLANWGLYEGKPVIIDLGLSNEIFDLHYRR